MLGGWASERYKLGMTGIFVLSVLGKLVKVKKGGFDGGHPAFGSGPDNLYPAWFLPIAVATEMATVLALWRDPPLGYALACTFIGGVAYTQSLPNGPMAKVGLKALIPGAFVAGCILCSLVKDAPHFSRVLEVRLPLYAFGACVLFGAATGVALGSVQGSPKSA